MKHLKRIPVALLVLSIILAFTACAKKSGTTSPPPPHAGAVNAFDSTVYDALVTLQAGIEQASVNPPAGQKPLINKLRAGYTTAYHAYLVYHAAALAGTATPQSQTDLQAQVDQLKSDLSNLSGVTK